MSVSGWGLHGAGFCKERVRSVRLSSPSWRSSISVSLVGVMKRRRVLAMLRCVCSGMCGQMAIPESVVCVPMSLRRVLACGHACISAFMFGSQDVCWMMILEALRKLRTSVEVCVRGASGPGTVGAILRLAGVRFPVVSSNQMRISSQAMPVLSTVVGVKVTLFQKVNSSCRKSAFVCHCRWQLISFVAVS